MNTLTSIARKFAIGFIGAACCLAFSGCNYEIPITTGPTRNIDERLLGNWVSLDGKENMKVRRLDDSYFIVSYNCQLFRAYHSDVDGTPFMSIHDIDSTDGKYIHMTYTISADGDQLVGKGVNRDVIPVETKDSVSVQRLLKENIENPELFEDEGVFTREK